MSVDVRRNVIQKTSNEVAIAVFPRPELAAVNRHEGLAEQV